MNVRFWGKADIEIEAALNHRSGHKAGVAGVYNRASYTRQIAQAISMWGERLDALVNGAEPKLISFPQAVR